MRTGKKLAPFIILDVWGFGNVTSLTKGFGNGIIKIVVIAHGVVCVGAQGLHAMEGMGIIMKVLNFGSMNLDYVYQVEHFVLPGETISAKKQTVNCGGKGLNQSLALAKAGAQVYHAGCVGQGGEMLLKALKEAGVHTDDIHRVDEIQGNAVIQVDKSGQNCILLFGGSNRCVTEEQIKDTLEHFEEGDYLVLQNEINLLPHIVNCAYDRGMKIVLNPSPCDDNLKQVDFSKVAWLILNEVEALQLTGSEIPEEAWRFLYSKYPGLSMVLTLGEKGSYCFTDDAVLRQQAKEATVVDTTAAGDTFTGYFLASVMEGMELRDCMERASVAAAICVTRPGAGASIPTKDEVFRKGKEELVKSYHVQNQTCKKGQVVFAGSSLMEMFPIQDWSGEWESAPLTYNRGVSGYTTLDMMPILDICVCELMPKKVFINIGTNDLSDPSYTIEDVMERYDSILSEIEEKVPGVVIYLMAYYPVNYEAAEVWMKPTLAVRNNQKIEKANKAVEELARRHGQRYIDVNKNLKDNLGNLKAEYTYEGMHIKPEGYRAILPEVMKYVLE